VRISSYKLKIKVFLTFVTEGLKKNFWELYPQNEDENVYNIIRILINNKFNKVVSSQTVGKVSQFLKQVKYLQQKLAPLKHNWYRGVNRPLYFLYEVLDDIEFYLREIIHKSKV